MLNSQSAGFFRPVDSRERLLLANATYPAVAKGPEKYMGTYLESSVRPDLKMVGGAAGAIRITGSLDLDKSLRRVSVHPYSLGPI